MPRLARIDIPGLLQHVIVRGIEKRDIFLDNIDRTAFVERLASLLVKTNTDCLAWALLSTHFHLLLRPKSTKLSFLMRRLLTGYAVVFNLRHHRCGHLFQNRYKSIVCEEEAYLLELVRYIHLNPLRAGLVTSLDMLDTFRWCGHSVLMGQLRVNWQQSDEVLMLFDETSKDHAKSRYRDFVADGIALGKRNELVGGGLRRYLALSGSHEHQAWDDRVLGSGEFVEHLWQEEGEVHTVQPELSGLEDLVGQVAAVFGIEPNALLHGGKRAEFSTARGAFCYIATRKLGFAGAEIAKMLNISRGGVALAADRGEAIYRESKSLQNLFRAT